MSEVVDWLYFKKNAVIQKLRALKNFYFFRRLDIKLGHNVFIRRGKGAHSFGRGLVVFDNSVFEVHSASATITTGDHCFFSYGVVIVCTNKIQLGNNVWIGEYTSLRDATHTFSADSPIGSKPDIQAPVIVGNNVWIGRGCLLLPGTVIGDNVIIAANSVVKGHCQQGSIYGGCPAKFIKHVSST